uniref:Neuropeptide-like 1 n=1 Tax=Carausius morosus TaxID=7022 RepID=A0A6G4ZU53_CARMO|nr:neuropeptide-like precursor 1 [Carausius morosus]
MTWSLCLLALIFALAQVHADDAEKRNVGSLARARMLPSAGKRYMAALARNGDLPYFAQRQWNKKLHPMVSGGGFDVDKRYVGALARGGALPFARQLRGDDDDDVGNVERILHDILDTEDRWRSQVDELKLQLMRMEVEALQADDDEQPADDEDVKRSVASLMRSGNMHFKSPVGKRNVEALARAGYLPAPKEPQSNEETDVESSEENNHMGKRSIASLAASSQLPYNRGGKRYDHSGDLDSFIRQLYEQEDLDKRNIGSLARGFSLPAGGKRNLGSFARSGGFSAIRNSPAKKGDEEEAEGNDGLEDDKRNLGSFARTRQSPLEGKRYLASALRGRSFSKKDDDEEVKRHVGSMARSNYLPFGKRFGEDDAEQYLQVVDGDLEQKRHLGSLAASGRQSLHKKSSRSTGSDLAAYRSNDTAAGDASHNTKSSASADEAVHTPDEASSKRTKRQAYFIPAPPSEISDEYPMPVIQNSELFDYEDMEDLLTGEGTPSKRFLGRIPQMGPRRRPKNWSGHQRRAHSRSD